MHYGSTWVSLIIEKTIYRFITEKTEQTPFWRRCYLHLRWFYFQVVCLYCYSNIVHIAYLSKVALNQHWTLHNIIVLSFNWEPTQSWPSHLGSTGFCPPRWYMSLISMILRLVRYAVGCTKMSKSCQNHFASQYILVLYICNPFLQKNDFWGIFLTWPPVSSFWPFKRVKRLQNAS